MTAADSESADSRILEAVRDSSQCPDMQRIRVDHVTETFDGTVVWDGEVGVFGAPTHPHTVYAWAWTVTNEHQPAPGGTSWHESAREDTNVRVVTVLGVPPIESAADAVRAAIASGHQE